MEQLQPPPKEKELPAPNEKLLRPPTFWEKQGKAAKWLSIGSIILFVFILLSASILLLRTPKIPTILPLPTPPAPTITLSRSINAIEISSDKKSILNAETKQVIFTIDDANKYLEDSGYAYDPDTFQTTNAKYAGDCFLSASLSNNKDRIVFSSGCLAGDLPQAWVGVYFIPIYSCKKMVDGEEVCSRFPATLFNFLIGGSGRNFIWSSDDKTITYEADLGLSGMTETRTIDAGTGEVLDTKKGIEKPETSCRNLCGDGICQEMVCAAIGCPCAETPQSCPQDCKKNGTGTKN